MAPPRPRSNTTSTLNREAGNRRGGLGADAFI
jgi:hypothetical protein